MNKKTITILITILAVVAIASGFWFVKNQNNVILNSFQNLNNNSQETQKQVEQNNVIPEKSGIQNKQNSETISQNNQENKAEELKVEDVDTSSWKTYRNEEFGFEFKYPNDIFNLQVLDNGMEISIPPFRGTVNVNLTKKNPDWRIAEKQSISWIFRGIDGSEKQAVVENKYKNFQQQVAINNLKGIIFSYGPDDIGSVNEWNTIDFTPFGSPSEHKKEIITEEVYNNSQYSKYKKLLLGNCDDISFHMILKKYVEQREDITDELVDELFVNCIDGDTTDAKTILTILQSFKFFSKNN